jgi:uncharacterized membrane-anchored protein
LTTPDTGDERSGLVEHFRRAIAHAMDALRCYVSLITADAEQRLQRSLRSTVAAATWVAFSVVGLVFLAGGAAELIDSQVGEKAPGIGRIIVGAVILAMFAVFLLAQRRGERQ